LSTVLCNLVTDDCQVCVKWLVPIYFTFACLPKVSGREQMTATDPITLAQELQGEG